MHARWLSLVVLLGLVGTARGQLRESLPSREHTTRYDSKTNCPLVTYITDGNHQFPSEAPAVIVKFFREHSRPLPGPSSKP